MTNLDALWVLPSDIDESLDIETIDPDDAQMLKEYETALAACEFASQTLWTLSGRKFHTGTILDERYILRPSRPVGTASEVRARYAFSQEWGAFLVNPEDWDARRIRLSGTPVREIISITSLGSGEALTPQEYAIENRAFLRLSGGMAKGVSVSYRYGQAPPVSGRMAAIALARQFFYLWSGREDQCALPDRITSVSRQGVSWVLLDNQDFLDELKTGIYAVDLFLRQVNPDKARVKAKVFSVDVPRGRRRTF